jgi:hypothetical protein
VLMSTRRGSSRRCSNPKADRDGDGSGQGLHALCIGICRAGLGSWIRTSPVWRSG